MFLSNSLLSRILCGLVLLCLSGSLAAQTIQSKTPSEQVSSDGIASQVQQYGGSDAYSVSAGGDLGLSVPITAVSGRKLKLPVSIAYSPGIKVDQKASDVGLGWDIGFGAIYRDIGEFEPDYTAQFRAESEGRNQSGYVSQFNSTLANINHLIHGETQVLDGLSSGQFIPDSYHLSAPGLGGNSFWTAEGVDRFNWSQYSNWRIEFEEKVFEFDQEFSRINELSLGIALSYSAGSGSHAAAIGIMNHASDALAQYVNSSNGSGVLQWDATALANTIIPNLKVKYRDFSSFTITTETGTQYIFGKALRKQKYVFKESPYWSTASPSQGSENLGNNPIYTPNASKGEFWKTEYIYAWLLTEIHSQDYVDINGDGTASDGDFGDWIRLEYTDDEVYQNIPGITFNNPAQNPKLPKYREYLNFSQTDLPSALWQEKAYLTKITSPTQELSTSRSDRYEVDHDYFSKCINQSYQGSDFDMDYPLGLQRYDSFTLTDRVSGKRIARTQLEYASHGSSEQLCKSSYLIHKNDNSEGAVQNDVAPYSNGTRGRTTLLGVTTFGTNNNQPQKYRFGYNYNPDYTDIHRAKMWTELFYPNKRESRRSLFNLNANYQNLIPSHPSGMSEEEFFAYLAWPYTKMYGPMGTSSNPNFVHHGIGVVKRMDECGYYYDENQSQKGRNAWSLSTVKYPTGGKMLIEYERDHFDYVGDRTSWSLKDNELTNVQTSFNTFVAEQTFFQNLISQYSLPICNATAYSLMSADAGFAGANTGQKRIAESFDFPMNEYSGGLRVKTVTLDDGLSSTYSTNHSYGIGGKGVLVEPSAAYWSVFMQTFHKHIRIQRAREREELYQLSTINSISGLEQFTNDFDFFDYAFFSPVRIDIPTSSQVIYPKIKEQYADGSFSQKTYRQSPLNTPLMQCRPLKNLGNPQKDVFVIASNALYGLGDHLKTEYFKASAPNPYASEESEYYYVLDNARQLHYRSWYTAPSGGDYPSEHWVPYYVFVLPAQPVLTNTGWVFANPGDNATFAASLASYLSAFITGGQINEAACELALNNLPTGIAHNIYQPQSSESFTRNLSIAKLLVRKKSMYEGVESETAFNYELDHFLLRHELKENSTPLNGPAQVLASDHRYAFDVFPVGSPEWNELDAKNMLYLPVENSFHGIETNTCCTFDASNILSSSASSFTIENQMGRSGIYPGTSYIFNSRNLDANTGFIQGFQGFNQPDFVLNNSSSNATPWVESSTVATERDNFGNAHRFDTPYNTGKMVFGYNGSVVKAVFGNTNALDASYIGFEDYFEYSQGNVQYNFYGDKWGNEWSFEPHIANRSLDAYNGQYSYVLQNGGGQSPKRTLNLNPVFHFPTNNPNLTNKATYVFSYWLKAPNGSGDFSADLIFDFGNTCNQQVHSRIYTQASIGSWQRMYGTVNLPINCGNPEMFLERTDGQGGNLLLDDFLIYPKGAEFETQSLDHHRNPVSRSDQRFLSIRAEYDQFGRLTKAWDANNDLISSFAYQLTDNLQNSNSYIESAVYSSSYQVGISRVYLDGLGRQKQNINWEPSHQRGVITQTTDYDVKGRPFRLYNPLPLPNLSSGLPAKVVTNYAARAIQFYGSTKAFSETIYDQTPDNRKLHAFFPRQNWQSSLGYSYDYMASGQAIGGYGPGELLRLDTYAEDGSLFITWVDKLGNLVQSLSPEDDGVSDQPLGGVNKGGSPLSNILTSYRYDRANRLIETINPENQSIEYRYASNGNTISELLPDRGLVEYRYDQYGRLRFEMDAEDRAYSQPVSSTYTCGIGNCRRFQYVKYDDLGHSIEEGVVYQDAAKFNDLQAANDAKYPQQGDVFQAHIQNTYSGPVQNNQGKLIEQKVSNDFTFDANSNQFIASGQDVYSYQYDENGRIKEQYHQLDGLAGIHELRFLYNRLGLPTIQFYHNPTMTEELVKDQGYDEWGRVLVTHSGSYNPASGAFDIKLDSRSEYDDIGRLYKKALGASGDPNDPFIEKLEFSHDIRNRMTRLNGDRFKMELTYDLRGNVLVNRWQNQHFDPDPLLWNQYRYQYDFSNRLLAADYSTVTYSTTGAPMARTAATPFIDPAPKYPNGILAYAKAKDVLGDIALPKASDVLRNEAIEPEVFAESPTAMAEALFNFGPKAFNEFEPLEKLDGVSFLKAIIAPNQQWTLASQIDLSSSQALLSGVGLPKYAIIKPSEKYDTWYRYDQVGNFTNLKRKLWDGLQVSLEELNYNYTPNKADNHLLSVNGLLYASNYSYDLNGNLRSDSEKNLQNITYDWRNLPVLISRLNESSSYRYNADGKRTFHRTTHLVAGNPVHEDEFIIGDIYLHGNGQVKRFGITDGYISLNPQNQNVERFYKLTDWLGSTRVVFDQSGTLINATDYYPYGKTLGKRHFVSDPEGDRKKFTGHDRDMDLDGVDYHGARYYNPTIGRYFSVDPLQGEFPQWSSYCYTLDNPIMLVDPDGKKPIPSGGGDGLVIIIAFPTENPRIPDNGSFSSEVGFFIERMFGDGDGAFEVGHAAIVVVNTITGESRYYDYGRYNRPDISGRGSSQGTVRSSKNFSQLSVPNWNTKKNSIENVWSILTRVKKSPLLKNYGRLEASVIGGIDFEEMVNYADEREGKGYSDFSCPTGDYCARFVRQVAGKGGVSWNMNTFTGKQNVENGVPKGRDNNWYMIFDKDPSRLMILNSSGDAFSIDLNKNKTIRDESNSEN